MNDSTVSQTGPAAKIGAKGVVRGLLWKEWLWYGRLIAIVLGLCFFWCVVLVMVHHPGVVIALGVLYALAASVFFGGSDTLAHTEEFALALPPTRG